MTDDLNRICESRSVQGLDAYMYAFKARAQRHHCLGYGTASLDVEALLRLHKQYCHSIRPITFTTLYVKATALALARNPEANAVLFRKPLGYRVVRFEQVDVNLPITRKLAGEPEMSAAIEHVDERAADPVADRTADQRSRGEQPGLRGLQAVGALEKGKQPGQAEEEGEVRREVLSHGDPHVRSACDGREFEWSAGRSGSGC